MRKSRIIQTGVATCILATSFLTYTDKANAEVSSSTSIKIWLQSLKNNEKTKDTPKVKHATTLGEIDKKLRASIKNKDFKKMVIQTETGAYYTVDLTQPLAEDRKKVVLDGKMYLTGLYKQSDKTPSKFIKGPGKKPIITFRPGI
ncbi:TPA: hypothetical protein O9547_002634 [Staphylococcus aureus]|nr:hypothetical protein [Staphylococcus aureus]HDD0311679.1 hypothetical protein [Staphylococcus aureus]HDD0314310.1 hypothetical protein [Staphylococcus aureus]HDD0317528.1 hypothetical protein [Staphylococcus aureus]HDD0443624.1 hypothetical protein [Staphylococcus aureus]